MYHPTLGRCLQRDPGGYEDGMSLYEYVGSSPVDVTDPFGLWVVDNRKRWLRGKAYAHKGDTIRGLAAKIHLDASEFKKWLKIDVDVMGLMIGKKTVRVQPGIDKTIRQLTEDDVICPGELFTVPNIALVHVGDVRGKSAGKYSAWMKVRAFPKRADEIVAMMEQRDYFSLVMTGRNGQYEKIISDLGTWGRHMIGWGFSGEGRDGDLHAKLRDSVQTISPRMFHHIVGHKLAILILYTCEGGKLGQYGAPKWFQALAPGGTLWAVEGMIYPVLQGMGSLKELPKCRRE